MSLDLLCLRLGEQIKIYKVKETFMLVWWTQNYVETCLDCKENIFTDFPAGK